ncbi:MAG TPA: hypothetical protein PKC26_11070, partial [Plasticicumulans sp.]|nr:hypothetical protein [Plasticicumulans sp.]
MGAAEVDAHRQVAPAGLALPAGELGRGRDQRPGIDLSGEAAALQRRQEAGRSRLELVGPLALRATCAGFDAAGSLWLGMERGAVLQVGDAFAATVTPVLHQGPWEADAAWLLPHPSAEGQLAVMNTHG